jgi:hypothetical protein
VIYSPIKLSKGYFFKKKEKKGKGKRIKLRDRPGYGEEEEGFELGPLSWRNSQGS